MEEIERLYLGLVEQPEVEREPETVTVDDDDNEKTFENGLQYKIHQQTTATRRDTRMGISRSRSGGHQMKNRWWPRVLLLLLIHITQNVIKT